ncbi:MAG: glycoside hydrolase family 3 C-terminal domain-containing protein, partial [Firmicutes bacterium]|nr:glycoside hydrolase family 3 C-terminal domain-containing protein [Bacillota bacterium]
MTRERARELAEALVSQMTVEEKASQLLYQAPAIDRLGVPAYNWWNEALHGLARGGTATSFPQAIGLAATFDDELLEKIASSIGVEARAKYNALSKEGDRGIYHGLTMWSPNINIFRDPRWGRGHETYGEDPYLTGRLGTAFVKGLQGAPDYLDAAKSSDQEPAAAGSEPADSDQKPANDGYLLAAACAKHFAVHSGPEATRHAFDAKASKKDMEETYLPAFRKLVKDGNVEAVMGAYNRLNGEPCCASNFLMKKLRDEWGFEGHFVSDCGAIQNFHEFHHVTNSAVESAAMALKAGCDLNCGCTYSSVLAALAVGAIDEADIDRSVVRLMTTRYLLGTLGEEGSPYDAISFDAIECDAHLDLAWQAAVKSCVLLKNDGLLPLDPKSGKVIGVIGPNANSRRALIGNYHGTSSRYITVLEGIQNLASEESKGTSRVLYSEGCALSEDRVEPLGPPNDRIAEAVAVARASDQVVLVVGLDETLEGEEGDAHNSYYSGDKEDLLLPQSQRTLMDAVLAVGKPTVIVLLCGSAIDLGPAAEKADALLLGWYPGARGGRAIADLLFGKVSPSGKLPVTFYRNDKMAEFPDFSDYSMKGRTYRYYQDEPLYPFGYGLTYGDTEVTGFSVEKIPASDPQGPQVVA